MIALISLICVYSEVTIVSKVQTIYDRSPKIRIKGSGFDADDHDLVLEISAIGESPLKVDKDFLVTKNLDEPGIVLKLMQGRKWVNLKDRAPPVGLVLSKVYLKSDENQKNLLPESKVIANVLATPTVEDNESVIYQSATNQLQINGTGFQGAKEVDLYFKPPLFVGVEYEVVSKFPLKSNTINIRIRHSYKWREEPGELKLVGIDTGGGPIKLNGDDGAVMGTVVLDAASHGASIDASAGEQLIYHDDPQVTITGAGFNTAGNTLRFANGLLGKGVNYTTESSAEDEITLNLKAGSFWRKNVENLPGFLTLIAIDAGDGFTAAGPINTQKGKDVATVFERPSVNSDNVKLYRTHSHELHIKGTGFSKVISKPKLKFSPALVEGDDYTINVISRTDMEVTLLDGKAWRSTAGPLQITAINTRGDEEGWIELSGGDGVHVAEVAEDIDGASTGGIEVYPMGTKVYQTSNQENIVISGEGFKNGMKFNFEPALKDGTDFDLEISSNTKAVLRQKKNSKWREDPGFIIAKSVEIDGKEYSLAGTDGIRVAVVLGDPVIKPGSESFHETQSKVIAIKGSGFTNVADTQVTIRPTAPGAYRILAVLEDTIRVQLKQGYDWLPGFLSLTEGDEDKKVVLQITGIDSGAGEVVYDEPITIGFVIKDREGVTCDDSCEFSFDDVCDDGTQSEYYEYYEEYGYYMDDDLGGYYEEDYAAYDDYFMEDDSYKVSACVEGTDCTDCGGVDAIVDYTKAPEPNSGVETCVNTCPYARDGVCDDPRGANYCKLGTDCQDCGPVGSDNFTRADDDEWWDDDDDYWTFNDGNFLDQSKGLEANRHRVKVFNKPETAGPAAMFLVVLEGMVYTVGAIFAAIALYLVMRWYRGAPLPFMNAFNPDSNIHSDLELSRQTAKKMPITPDAFRT